MPHVSGDRVKETTTTTGTGNITVLGAVANFTTIASEATADGDTFDYAIIHQTANEWETGIGTRVSATVFSRSVLESSNADALVSLSAGTKDVFIDRPARLAVQMKIRATPLAAAADWITSYAALSGSAQVRTKDQHGLIDVLSERDKQRVRKAIRIGVGSDALSTSTDWFCMGVQPAAIEGTIANTLSALDGHSKLLTTAATINTDAGLLGGYAMFERGTNPDFTVKFRVNSTLVRRVWIGFFEADPIAADTNPTIHSFALRLSTAPAVTGFTIVHSDGTTETVEAQIQASDANIHTIRLIADAANNRFGYSFDGAAIVWITTNIPAATADLGIHCQIRTLEAVAKNMGLWWIDGTVDA